MRGALYATTVVVMQPRPARLRLNVPALGFFLLGLLGLALLVAGAWTNPFAVDSVDLAGATLAAAGSVGWLATRFETMFECADTLTR